MWTDFFTRVCLINLPNRTDRLQAASELLTNFEIPFEVIAAIENTESPCIGLVDTMQKTFKESLDAGHSNIMLLEDDIGALTTKEVFHNTINECVCQLPQDYGILYLGCNPAGGLKFYSSNLFYVRLAFATHAACYSKSAMQYVISHTIKEPIDNFLVRDFQNIHRCYCTFPMLLTQIPGYSDIGKSYTDWSNFLEKRFNEQVQIFTKD